MLWTEKKNPGLLFYVLELGIVESVVSLLSDDLISLLKVVIMLLGNCVEDGVIINQLFQSQYGEIVFKNVIFTIDPSTS